MDKKIFDPRHGIPTEWKDVILSYNGLQCYGPTVPQDKVNFVKLKQRVENAMKELGAQFSPFYLDELEISDEEVILD